MRARRSAASLRKPRRSKSCCDQLAETFGLPRPPRRIEVYDNSHIQGTNAVGAMIVAGPEGFRKKDYRKFNIRSTELTPGDDFAMMREVLERRFKRLMNEAPRLPSPLAGEGGVPQSGALGEGRESRQTQGFPNPHPPSLCSGSLPRKGGGKMTTSRRGPTSC